MGADYRKFKTPFFDIEIGDSSGKRLAKLPQHILRLVQKVEMFESFEPGQFSTITVTFIEGSREPASPDASLGTAGLYNIPFEGDKIDMDISGSITNRTGSIADLRFSGSGGITFLTEQERKKGAVSTIVQKNVIGKNVTRKHKTEPRAPVFLFQERNQMKVTWGYKEDPSTIRSMRGYILVLQQTFPEDGQPTTTVTCHDTGAALDQIASTKGIPFGRRITSSKGNSIVTFEDLKSDVLIREICDKAGIPCIVSTNLPSPTIDKDKQKIWVAGESFNQFMTKLADDHNAYYKVIPDPKTGVDTLIFIKKTDFESKVIINDRDLLTYKAAGSILKSVQVKADFAGLAGNSQTGLLKTGETASQTVSDPQEQVRQFESDGKKEQLMALDPTTNNPVNAAKAITDRIAGGEVSGTVDNNPSENDLSDPDKSQIKADMQHRMIQVEFATMGFTKLTPGVVELRNLGIRYSGKYRVLTVTHTIDASGYGSKATATSMALATGGVINPEAEKTKDKVEQVDVQQFTPARENLDTTKSSGVRDNFDRFQGTN